MSITKLSNLLIIDNSGPNNLHDILSATLNRARQADIAVAFITDAGLAKILPSLRQVASIGKVRVITGLYQGVTEPKALRTLSRAQKETRGNLSVKLSKESKFHRKIYITENKSTVTAIIGSSNLTKEGLISGGELSIAFTFSKDSKSYLKLNQAFEKDWKYHSVSLSDAQIRRYEKYHRESKEKSKLISIPLRKILGEKTIHQKGEVLINKSITFWRDCITGFVKKQTEQIISQQTSWDEKNYIWYSAGKHKYKINDELLMFDFADNFASLVKITDTTEINTPDGRYFVAFKQLKNTQRKLLKKPLWDRLKSLCIIRNRNDANNYRKLSQSKWEMLKDIFYKGIKRASATSSNNRPKD
ncbi:MAG: hypothetical protein FJ241_06470 [Nitrospira sp.]|nr:hypothetical protein [Nitrospira sp.]